MSKHHPNAGCLEGFNKLFLARPSTNVAFRKQHITFIAPHLPQDRRIVIPDILNVSTNCFSVAPVPTYRSVNSTLLRLPRIRLSTAGYSSPTAGLISTLIS